MLFETIFKRYRYRLVKTFKTMNRPKKELQGIRGMFRSKTERVFIGWKIRLYFKSSTGVSFTIDSHLIGVSEIQNWKEDYKDFLNIKELTVGEPVSGNFLSEIRPYVNATLFEDWERQLLLLMMTPTDYSVQELSDETVKCANEAGDTCPVDAIAVN